MEEAPPTSILVIGSGVFGLSTAWALTKRQLFAKTAITVVDNARGEFPPRDSASVDLSRIIRADYADPHYTALATLAQQEWRRQGADELGGQGRYTESGFVLTANLPMDVPAGTKSSMDYTRESWENVVDYAAKEGLPTESIQRLESREAVKELLTVDGHCGDWGYLNKLSGWADAGKGMKWLYDRVMETNRVRFVDGQVMKLETVGDKVVGAQLSDGVVVRGDVVLVAAGAWTGELIDLRGRVEATGHALAYVDIAEDELAVLAKQPVVLNLSSGLFIIPPRDRVLKVARHGFGYLNPELVTNALPPSPSSERKPFVTSRPVTERNGGAQGLPEEADVDLRRGLKDLSPVKGLETRPWKETRLCWYSDTADGDWLVDWHPGWKGLFIATGDSGHGFKFLPVVGERIVDCMLGSGGELGRKWKWKDVDDDGVGHYVNGGYNGLMTRDGSRGGHAGMILREEREKK
ncbi:hypothetical protein RJ55_05506 [Drechmeria coniospora]|nr:hypothetical protein RJ55_05506 [Drechmeria coniospora]